MEKIRNFVENLFFGLPDSPQVREAKEHLTEGMCDRYEELLARGESEAEAFGTVVGEFGSMEELLEGLGISREPRPLPPEDPRSRPDFPREEYEAFRRRYPVAMAMGVALCILALAVRAMLPRELGAVRDVALLLMLAAAVWDFVYLGLRRQFYEGRQQMTARKNRVDNIQGVVMLSATAVYLILGFCWHLWHPGWVVFVIGAALCVLAEIIWPKEQ